LKFPKEFKEKKKSKDFDEYMKSLCKCSLSMKPVTNIAEISIKKNYELLVKSFWLYLGLKLKENANQDEVGRLLVVLSLHYLINK